jgi:hypothetical protein
MQNLKWISNLLVFLAATSLSLPVAMAASCSISKWTPPVSVPNARDQAASVDVRQLESSVTVERELAGGEAAYIPNCDDSRAIRQLANHETRGRC